MPLHPGPVVPSGARRRSPGGRPARHAPGPAATVAIAAALWTAVLLAACGPGTSARPDAVASPVATLAPVETSTAAPTGPTTPPTGAAGIPSVGSASPPAVSPLPVALVPVVAPASSRWSITTAELASALSDGGILVASDVDPSALAAVLGVAGSNGPNAPGAANASASPAAAPASPVAAPASPATAPTAPVAASASPAIGRPENGAAVVARVAADPAAVGLVRAVDVTPDVRALPVDGRSLFGARRVHDLADWPLTMPAANDPAAIFDPAAAWTLVAGGDVMLDRGVYRQAVLQGKGVDFPWDGGSATVTGTRCCGAAGARLPVGRRAGDAGAVRRLLSAADLALVNLEGPAPDAFGYHPGGLVFSFDPALLTGVARAGIDVVSLANNHVMNAGAGGLSETIRHLDEAGLAHAGAGPDLAAARRPAVLRAGRHQVAVLAYDAIRPSAAATAKRPGTAPLRLDLVRRDIAAARAAGAEVVIVVPHWGVEYADRVSGTQRRPGRPGPTS